MYIPKVPYSFYTDEFLAGDMPAISEQQWGRLEQSAVAVLEQRARYKVRDFTSDMLRDNNSELPRLFKMAVCALAEILREENEAAKKSGISSEKYLSASVTYSVDGGKKSIDFAKDRQSAINKYFGGTEWHNLFVFAGV